MTTNLVRHLSTLASNPAALGAIAELIDVHAATLQAALLLAISTLRLFGWWRTERQS